MRVFASLAFVCLASAAATGPAGADPVVVELFTSQGCSSCPPADEMLGVLAGREGVLALSLHVDYWDWIGWEDTFAQPALSDRQRAYAAVAGSSVVYTPQFVVGGASQIAGPAGMELAALIADQEDDTGDVLRLGEGQGEPRIEAAAIGRPAKLILVAYLPKATVRILHGENAGKDMTYHNVVHRLSVLADWDGKEASVAVPPPEPGLSQAVFAQVETDKGPGRILGAVRLD